MIPEHVLLVALGTLFGAIWHALLNDKSSYRKGYIDGLNLKEKLKHIDMKIDEENRDDSN